MNIAGIPIAEHHTEGFRSAVNDVAQEGLFLAALEAPPLESARELVLGNIKSRNPQFVAEHDGQVVGWCDIARKKWPTAMSVFWEWAS